MIAQYTDEFCHGRTDEQADSRSMISIYEEPGWEDASTGDSNPDYEDYFFCTFGEAPF